MKMDIISLLILLLGFVSISVTFDPQALQTSESELEANLVQTLEPELAEYLAQTSRPTLDPNILNRYLIEINTDEPDDRPQVIQDLEERFEDGLDTFIKEGLQDFKDVAPGLKEDTDSFTERFFSSSNEFDEQEFERIHLLAKEFATHLEKFKAYFKSIRGLNNGLMDQLKEVFNKIITFSSDNPLIDIIPVISQAMKCRFKVVYAINWIRVRLDYIENKVEWMPLNFKELVKLKQKYDAIEMNLNEYLTSFNEMILNPDKRDDSKVKKIMDYFEETIEEGEFISKTQDIIEIMETLDMKPGARKRT